MKKQGSSSTMGNRQSAYFVVAVVISILVINFGAKAFASLLNRPFVIISIDAETVGHDNHRITLPEQFDLKINEVYCGITKMMEICDKYNVKATFFLNVYEFKKYGEPTLEKIAKVIDARGFDIQLHTHPQWAYDPKRNMMYQYTLDEQTQIIKDGKNLINKWINTYPVIHRAGAYSANEDTLKALNTNNIFYDSSFFFSYSTCLLQNLGLKKNYISTSNGVYQIPVSVFMLERYPTGVNYMTPLKGVAKYDIDSLDYSTMIEAVDKGIENQFDAIVLFLHSFSFIKEYNEKKKTPDLVDIEEFDNVLSYINQKGLRIVTFRSFIEEINKDELKLRNTDVIPIVSTEMNTFKYLAKRVGIDKRNIYKVIVYASVFFIILMIALTSFVRRKRDV